jgi:hypothetical protein
MHYISENLVAPGMEPGTSKQLAGLLFCSALSDERGRICNLLLLLALASAVLLGSESRGTQDHIFL